MLKGTHGCPSMSHRCWNSARAPRRKRQAQRWGPSVHCYHNSGHERCELLIRDPGVKMFPGWKKCPEHIRTDHVWSGLNIVANVVALLHAATLSLNPQVMIPCDQVWLKKENMNSKKGTAFSGWHRFFQVKINELNPHNTTLDMARSQQSCGVSGSSRKSNGCCPEPRGPSWGENWEFTRSENGA